ncbi:MAG: hypothetical protein KME64_36815 [Scytonematopsis contorta HA4267-MV1]|nr:hypothetical protein [Scytonematopsis contorta HA4267-MV1]
MNLEIVVRASCSLLAKELLAIGKRIARYWQKNCSLFVNCDCLPFTNREQDAHTTKS